MQKINLYAGRYILIIELSSGETVAIPTSKAVALTLPQWAGRVLSVDADGSFAAHWLSNYNTNGDFKTELLTFNSNLSMVDDLAERNAIRLANGLMAIS